MCTVCPSSVIILFIVVCTIIYHLFSFIFSFYLSKPSPKFLILFLPSTLLYLFIPCPLTYPYTFPSNYLFQTVLNFPSSYSLCFTLTSFHYIFFLIFHLLIICPMILLVFPSVSFFLYTSFKRILCVVLLRNRSVLMFIRCQFKCISEINTRLKLWFLLQRLPTLDKELPPQGLFHKKKKSPTERHTFLARFKLSIPEFGLLHLNSWFIN